MRMLLDVAMPNPIEQAIASSGVIPIFIAAVLLAAAAIVTLQLIHRKKKKSKTEDKDKKA